MARVDIFKMVNSISKESISHPDVADVTVDAKNAIPSNATSEPKQLVTDELPKADDNKTKTSEPGPEDGGGDGTAETVEVKEVKVKFDVTDVNKNLVRDQQGGEHVDKLPNQVNATDNLSSSDVCTSVEEHKNEGSEVTELESIDASGAETIENADDLVMDLDGDELEVTGITDVTENALSECDSLSAKANDLSKATATVERYHGLMVQMRKEGRYMSDELRQSISWALEDISAELFVNERAALESFNPKSRVSLEASGVQTNEGSIDDGSDPGEVGKGLSSKLKKLFDAGLKIFFRMMNAVADLVTSFIQDAGKIKQHLVELRKSVNVLEGGVEFKMRGAHRLIIGDEFVGDSKNAIANVTKVAEELLMKWPSNLAKVLTDWTDGRSEPGLLGKVMDGVDTSLNQSFRSFSRLDSSNKDLVPSGFLSMESISWSKPLPGNMALYYGVVKSNSGDAFKDVLEDSDSGAKVYFSLIPEHASHSGEVVVSTPSAAEAISVIRELEKLIQFVMDAKSGMKALKKFADSTSWQGEMTSKFSMNSSVRLSGMVVINLAKTSTDSQHRFIGYLINMIKAYSGYLSAAIKAESTGDVIEGK